jgi:putative DNA primase/helicase
MEEYHSSVNDKPHDPNQIPEELKCVDQWMGTRFKRRKDGKLDKPPHRVRRGQRIIKADKTDPKNWATFDEALAAYQRGDVDAIGFVFSEDEPLHVVDLDSVIDHETGEIQPEAAQIIHAHATYTELSCSGEGVHVIGEGKKPAFAGCKSSRLGFEVEVYDSHRFLVVTGNRLPGTPEEPQRRQRELDELCRTLWPKREKFARGPRMSAPVDIEDEELLERARRSRGGAKFKRLYDQGDISGYKSASEADFALLNTLIFWTAGDRERIVRLFEASALFRAKDKHRTYAELSAGNALASYTGAFYQPRRVEKARAEEKPDPLTPYLAALLDPSLWTGRKGPSAYKAFAGMVILASEDGIVEDSGKLRIGADIRRLAEVAGTRFQTLSESALPHLMQNMKLLTWRRGKGRRAGVFVLKNPLDANRNTKESTHFSVPVSDTPENALETLRLIVRMRRGNSHSQAVLRLGMVAMFTTIALLSAPSSRGYDLTELGERTGRRKSDLRDALEKLKAAGIVREPEPGIFRLTADFHAHYRHHLERSGVLCAERAQKRRHADHRKRRGLGSGKDRVDAPKPRLRGPEHMERVLGENERRERQKKPPGERTLTVEQVASEIRRERSGPYLAYLHYLRAPNDVRLGWLTNAVLRVRWRDPTKQRGTHLEVVRQAARDPANHPGECPCRGCA